MSAAAIQMWGVFQYWVKLLRENLEMKVLSAGKLFIDMCQSMSLERMAMALDILWIETPKFTFFASSAVDLWHPKLFMSKYEIILGVHPYCSRPTLQTDWTNLVSQLLDCICILYNWQILPESQDLPTKTSGPIVRMSIVLYKEEKICDVWKNYQTNIKDPNNC